MRLVQSKVSDLLEIQYNDGSGPVLIFSTSHSDNALLFASSTHVLYTKSCAVSYLTLNSLNPDTFCPTLHIVFTPFVLTLNIVHVPVAFNCDLLNSAML